MVIGDYLNDEDKRSYIRSHLVPGAILYRHCEFTKPPKIKYLMVVQVQTETVVLVINSTINSFIRARGHLMDCQVPIDCGSHPCLDHDSFVDCTETAHLDTTTLIEEIMQSMDILAGQVTPELKDKVIAALNDCYTISPAEIASIVASLSV